MRPRTAHVRKCIQQRHVGAAETGIAYPREKSQYGYKHYVGKYLQDREMEKKLIDYYKITFRVFTAARH